MVCASCGTENPDAARFCLSCGSSLVPACPVCGAERIEGARFCPSCGTALTEGVPAPRGQERRLVTILFTDIVGSTSLGEGLDPERLQDVLRTYFDAMREEIEAEGGTVEKFIGDAVVAAFGVPIAHEDDPIRALHAALRMRRRLERVNATLDERFGVTLRIRTGVNTGEVLAATDPKPGDPMVTGDAVNVAARLEQSAEADTIVVAERTARAARGFRYRELGDRDVRGRGDAVAAVLLEDEAPERPERGVPGLRAPMVGRDQELALLETLYGRALTERRPALVTVYGEPGVGKSRLVREFLDWARSQQPAPYVTVGRCLPYGEGVTYWPLAEILKRHAGVQDSDPTDTVLDKIERSCDEVLRADPSIDAARACRALAYTAGVEFPSAPMADREPRQVRAEMHSAWRSFFSALSRTAPVVAVIEDIHWADEALLDLLDEIGDKAIGPVLLLCPARPELLDRRQSWGGGRRNFSSITLDPLSSEDSDRLVRLLLTVDDLPPAVHRRILERAEGNPFFLEEIVRHLIDDGLIVRDGDRWRADARISDVEIPDTVQAVLAARIDILGPDDKRALQRAAVVGRIFWPGPVRRLLNGDGERIAQTLVRLEERELVSSRLGSAFAGESEFSFKHILTREVAYGTLPRRERGRAHASVASWIEEVSAERAPEFVELLAYHYGEALAGAREDTAADPVEIERLRVRSLDVLLDAAAAAHRRFAVASAMRLAEQGLAVATTPIERARGLELVGVIATADYRGDLAWTSLREAARLRVEHAPEDRASLARVCSRAVEPPTRWPGSMKLLVEEHEIVELVELGLANVDPGEASESHMRLLIAEAFGPFSVGQGRTPSEDEVEAAAAAGERAAEMALEVGRVDLASAALDGADSALMVMGRYGRLVTNVERRIDLAPRIDDPWEVGDIFAMGAWTFGYLGHYRRAREFAEEGAFRATDDAEGQRLHNLNWSAYAAFHLGDWDRLLDEVFPKIESMLSDREPPYFTAQAYGAAAFATAERGEARAGRLERTLRELAGEGYDLSIVTAGWLAWIHAHRGDGGTALDIMRTLSASPSGVARPHVDQMHAAVLSDLGAFDGVETFLAETRRYAVEGGLAALPIHLDALEGRAAAAAGDLSTAKDLLRDARSRFADLGCRYEAARVDVSLATALAEARPEESRARLASARAEFERLGAGIELERVAEVEAQLR